VATAIAYAIVAPDELKFQSPSDRGGSAAERLEFYGRFYEESCFNPLLIGEAAPPSNGILRVHSRPSLFQSPSDRGGSAAHANRCRPKIRNRVSIPF